MKMNQNQCMKFPHELIDNFNIVHNATSSMIAFWNEYEIFLTNEQGLVEYGTRQYYLSYCTEFIIKKLLLAENHIICLDNNGNLYSYSLKLKRISKTPRLDFKLLEQNIFSIDCNEALLFSTKCEANKIYLRIDKIHSDLQLQSLTIISSNDMPLLSHVINRDKCILHCYLSEQNESITLKNFFKEKTPVIGKSIVAIMSFDKYTIYAVLIDFELDKKSIYPIKLLTCPTEINNISIIKEEHLNVTISLNAGTVIKLPLSNEVENPKIVHLNTTIHKCLASNCEILYTDGNTMWISEKISISETKLRQLFVKHVKDFIKIDNKIICTTYSKLLYIFYLDDESSYQVPTSSSEYCSAEHLHNNKHYLHRIMEEVKENDRIIINIKEEENYITALALSNRQDIMSEAVQYIVNVYENYEDIVKEDLLLNLTNDIKEYLDANTYHFLIKIIISASLQQNSYDLLSHVFNDLNIHLTILSNQKIIKTICINVPEQLKILNFVVPLKADKLNLADVSMCIKLVKKIPKILNSNENLLITLYCKHIVIAPEHFIKTNETSKKVVQFLKEQEDSIENLLYKTAHKYHGHLYKIMKVPNVYFKWSFYVKLPETYKELLKDNQYYVNHFERIKAKFLLKEISSKDFLNSRCNIFFYILNERINIEIVPDELSTILNSYMIKVECENPLFAFGIRDFFSNLIHYNTQEDQSVWKFISHNIFISIEELETDVNKSMEEQDRLTFEEFFIMYEQYQKNLFAILI